MINVLIEIIHQNHQLREMASSKFRKKNYTSYETHYSCIIIIIQNFTIIKIINNI